MNNPSFKSLVRSPNLMLAFGFGSGLSPVVPGTLGTLVAIPLYLCLSLLPLVFYAATILLTALWGVYLCGYASKTLGVHDHKGIVWDEFVGFWITMFAIPLSWQSVVVGFVLFRFFDMVKPWPICLADKNVHGGFGIMLDDILAGLVSSAILHMLTFGGWL